MIIMYKPRNVYACDFETTVYDNQDHTEVWSAAFAKINSEEVKVFHSIDSFFHYFFNLKFNVLLYFHNMKFDGSFCVDYWLRTCHFKEAFNETTKEYLPEKEMENGTFTTLISDFGQWYSIKLKINDHFIELRDSLKLVPFSLRDAGKAFKTEHQKLDMVYTGYRYAGCQISDTEMKYIINDVLVLKEVLEFMFSQKHDKLTIGACCYDEFKKGYAEEFSDYFPNLSEIKLDPEIYGSENAEEYVRKSYRGGWCYVVPEKAGKIYKNGITLDCNSLYPSMMESNSGNYFPIRKPTFFTGKIPDACYNSRTVSENPIFWFVRFKCRFKIKPGYLPFVQIKRNWLYSPNQCLKTSDIWSRKENRYYSYYTTPDGEIHEAKPELTMACKDFELFMEHYNVYDLEILDGCWFYTEIGLFDKYLRKYKEIKMKSTGAMRTLAKMFLNTIYGRMATSPDSSFKRVFMDPYDETIHFQSIPQADQTPGYIAIGSAITSYARNFTIRAAQLNYHGINGKGFIYADTDSLHLDIPLSEVHGVKIHDSDFGCWKQESTWKRGIFVRAKTYLEETDHGYEIRCAGLSDHGKAMLIGCFGDDSQDIFSPEEFQWIQKNQMDIDGFKRELTIPGGKLTPIRMKGGIVLTPTAFTIL